MVEVRAGQDSGYFFAGPTVNALTYSGDAGLDVVNMSFYVDPWLYNCQRRRPGGHPRAAAGPGGHHRDGDSGRSTTRTARASRWSRRPATSTRTWRTRVTDLTSPDYGRVSRTTRTIDNDNCFDLPVEGPHVLGVTALGPSKRSRTTPTRRPSRLGRGRGVGARRLVPGRVRTPSYRTNENLILSTYPWVAAGARPRWTRTARSPAGKAAGVVKQCQDVPAPGTSACGYYAWLQGTSMASPHATGVAALAIGAARHRARRPPTSATDPDKVRAPAAGRGDGPHLPERAAHGVPTPTWAADEEFTAECVGTPPATGSTARASSTPGAVR